MAKVSIVIVNYNSDIFLEHCVSSVLQSDCVIEIIIVDNASTDHSLDFLGPLELMDTRISVVRNSSNLGFARAVNLGVQQSTGRSVLLLNPDTLILAHTIRLLDHVLNQNSKTGIVGGLVFAFEGSEHRGCRRRDPT